MARARAGTAGDDDHDEHVIHEEWESVGVRRAPRIGHIMGAGIGLGLAAALILTVTAAFNEQPGGPLSTGASGYLRVFGVFAVICVGFGLLVAGLIVIVLDRRGARRERPAIAEHATTLTDDLVSPMTDEVPQWVRDAEGLDAEEPDGPERRRPKG
ncbi:hypothetical protein ACFT30_10300 [Microbacterium ureisolvens]|uniref:hypothetical protein n=1 Tax=Microbacterium TaxID=33882 RepID=UPI000D654230|nr:MULTISPECIES: hypothetical protein [Microbacterium]